VDFYWKNDLTTNSFKNFKMGDPFTLKATGVTTPQDKSLIITNYNNNIKYYAVDFTKKNYGWNDACIELNNVRRKIGLPPYKFTTVQSGGYITADVFNEVRLALNSMLPYLQQATSKFDESKGLDYLKFSVPTLKSKGETINADYFNQIAEMLSLDKLSTYAYDGDMINNWSNAVSSTIGVIPKLDDNWFAHTNTLTEIQYSDYIGGNLNCPWSTFGQLSLGLMNQNLGDGIYTVANYFITCYLNLILDPTYGAIFTANVDWYNDSMGVWYKIPPEIMSTGTFGIFLWDDTYRGVYSGSHLKDFAGVNFIVRNEIPDLRVVVTTAGETKYYPRIKCYGEVSYLQNMIDTLVGTDSNGNSIYKMIYDYSLPVFPITRMDYKFTPHYYNGYIYYVGNDNRMYRYNPNDNSWQSMCGGEIFDFSQLGKIRQVFCVDNYMWFFPSISFGIDTWKDFEGRNIISGYHCCYMYRIDLNQNNNEIEKIQFHWEDFDGEEDPYNVVGNSMWEMDMIYPSTDSQHVHMQKCDGSGNFQLFVVDLLNLSVKYGTTFTQYNEGDSYALLHLNEFIENQNYRDYCEYSDFDKIVEHGGYLYYFDYYDTFKRYDMAIDLKDYTYTWSNGVQIKSPHLDSYGNQVYISGDTRWSKQETGRMELTQPTVPCGYPIRYNDYIFAQSLDDVVPTIYKYDIYGDTWTITGEIPIHY
jgi:hypothetical protein